VAATTVYGAINVGGAAITRSIMVYGSLFTGMGGADIGAREAGFELAWGNELDPAIAEVGNFNLGNHIRAGDLLEQDPRSYAPVDALHMSPPCTRASTANQTAEVNEDGLKESPLDMALANKCIEFVEVHRPQIVTLENVWAYRKFQSWRGGKKSEGIQQALYRLGYWLSVEHVNCADLGVPQTRRRMIVRAIRGGFVPRLPAPVRWVGWYEAIEDILHTLPDSQFAPWQLERLPEEIKQTLMLWNMDQTVRDVTVRYADQPVPTVDTGMMRRPSSVPQAILFSDTGGHESYGDHHVTQDQPSGAVTAQSLGRAKAFLIDSKNVNQEYGKLYRSGDEPALTVTTDGKPSHMPRAFLIGKNQDKFGDGIRYAVEPAQTIGANEHGSKAFIIDGKNSGNFGNGPTILNGEDPIFTVQASQAKGMPRAFTGCRIVAMTPRALARFQSIPDWVVLPESKTLAAKVIGNAVPPLVMEKVYKDLRDCL
jgi:site-specific DNA-cytosine methylase